MGHVQPDLVREKESSAGRYVSVSVGPVLVNSADQVILRATRICRLRISRVRNAYHDGLSCDNLFECRLLYRLVGSLPFSIFQACYHRHAYQIAFWHAPDCIWPVKAAP